MSIEQTVYKAALAGGMPVKLAELITAQSKHESANYTSNVFLKNNNLFGYKFVGQKLATRGTPSPLSEGDNYAKYETVADSVAELVQWIKRRQAEKKFPKDLKVINTAEIYAGLLKGAGYYGASLVEYTAGLKRFFKNISPLQGGGISAVMVVLVAAVWLIFKK